ncbi:hypothetical protein ARMSODRAFT_1022464 [Armillaria solidipes]|uniref:Uncharacterized protein n=1 Tax=Armillaria solidipes TaxID=1076256 RepID=A0A2H3B368_9AGAR|nr:hypothetical protein ARMSODRAFT_1022464 [Armillaria solidipes]
MITMQDLSASYHPSFNTSGADAFLSSLEDILYRLPSLVLRKTTKFLASSSFTFKPNSNPIPIQVHDVVLEQLLQILSGVLRLAEAWGARAVLDIFVSITAPLFLREPLRVYAVVTRFRWEEEAEFASKHTLGLSLRAKEQGSAAADLDALSQNSSRRIRYGV